LQREGAGLRHHAERAESAFVPDLDQEFVRGRSCPILDPEGLT